MSALISNLRGAPMLLSLLNDGAQVAQLAAHRGNAKVPMRDRIAQRLAAGILMGARDHGDAAMIPIWGPELEALMGEVYEEEYIDLPMANGDILPLNTDVANWQELWKYRTLQKFGKAKIGTDYAIGSIPRVSVGGKEFVGYVAAIFNAYGFSIQDERVLSNVSNGARIQAMFPEAARRAHEEITDRVAWWGDTKHKLHGLLTHPYIPKQYAPVGANNSTYWSAKTFDEIFADIALLEDAAKARTFGKEYADVLLLPRDVSRVMVLKRIEQDKQTLRVHVKENFPDLKIMFVDQLNATHPDNPTGVGIAVSLRIDKKAASLVSPQPFEQFPPAWHGLEWLTICHSRIGGVMVPRPYSVTIMPGVSGP